jgi:hypothetical protein
VVHQVSEPPHIPPADIIVPRQLQHRISCTAVSRLIRALDTRKTRARLDRLVRDGKIQRKREQGTHGPVYLFRRHS